MNNTPPLKKRTIARQTTNGKRVTANRPAAASKPVAAGKRAADKQTPADKRTSANKRTKSQPAEFELRLYVAGQTPKSLTALANLRRICESNLEGRYSIEVIDLLENPQLARGDQILAIPTLVRRLPEPIKKIIGDLSHTERVLVGLDIRPVD